jgi:hypothetical protein
MENNNLAKIRDIYVIGLVDIQVLYTMKKEKKQNANK